MCSDCHNAAAFAPTHTEATLTTLVAPLLVDGMWFDDHRRLAMERSVQEGRVFEIGL